MEPIGPIPPVFDLMRDAKGGSFPGASREVGSVSDSSASDSLRSVFLRGNQKEGSSREKRPAAVGEAVALPPNGFDSRVSRRRAPGRVAEEGELTPKLLDAPWDSEAFRPFALTW